MPNQAGGLFIDGSTGNIIGNVAPGLSLGNTISGNLGSGISISDRGSSGLNEIYANRIGVALDGVMPLGNSVHGVRVFAGGQNAFITNGNLISNNGGAGIALATDAGAGIYIRGDSFSNNGGLGIDLLEDGVTPNGPSPRVGPNDLVNYPVFSTVATSGGRTVIAGTLQAQPDALYTLDFYDSPAADPSAYGEGNTAFHVESVLCDSSGFASFHFTVDPSVTIHVVSATATNGTGSTSEFSKAIAPIDTLGPRSNGGEFLYETAPLQVKIKFDEDVGASISPAAFTIARIGAAGTVPVTLTSYTASTFTAFVTLGTVPPDGNYRLTALASVIHDVNGNPLDGNRDDIGGDDFTSDFFVLAGDANRDRTVGFQDLVVLSQNYNLTGKTFSQGNFNYSVDGRVDFADLVILAQNYNITLPALSLVTVIESGDRSHKAKRANDNVLN